MRFPWLETIKRAEPERYEEIKNDWLSGKYTVGEMLDRHGIRYPSLVKHFGRRPKTEKPIKETKQSRHKKILGNPETLARFLKEYEHAKPENAKAVLDKWGVSQSWALKKAGANRSKWSWTPEATAKRPQNRKKYKAIENEITKERKATNPRQRKFEVKPLKITGNGLMKEPKQEEKPYYWEEGFTKKKEYIF